MQLNREEAILELSNRTWKQDDSPHTNAHKLIELVKLAYPTLNEETRATLEKDYSCTQLLNLWKNSQHMISKPWLSA